MAKTKVGRVEEIRKAIKLLGWTEIRARIRSLEDHEIFNQLGEEAKSKRRAEGDRILWKHKIKF